MKWTARKIGMLIAGAFTVFCLLSCLIYSLTENSIYAGVSTEATFDIYMLLGILAHVSLMIFVVLATVAIQASLLAKMSAITLGYFMYASILAMLQFPAGDLYAAWISLAISIAALLVTVVYTAVHKLMLKCRCMNSVVQRPTKLLKK